jgi:DinB family protein
MGRLERRPHGRRTAVPAQRRRAALVAFRRRRAETLDLFAGLAPGQWEKSGIHPVRGRFTIDAILSVMAWHDDNHLAQLIRALEGRV